MGRDSASQDSSDSPRTSRRDIRTARVTYVQDGDSLVVDIDGRRQVVRLIGIDAPEKSQPFAEQARAFVETACLGKHVRLIEHGTDRYDRLLAELLVAEENLNRQLVREGWAWCYDRNEAELVDLENQARMAQRGLWADENPIRPADWRNMNREPR